MSADSEARALPSGPTSPGIPGGSFPPLIQASTDSGEMLLAYSANDNERDVTDIHQGFAYAQEDDLAAVHCVGRLLIQTAARDGRRAAATAAAEVFRVALSRFPDTPSLHNGLGAALVEIARTEATVGSTAVLADAVRQFEIASKSVDREATPATYLRYQINLATTLWMQAERSGNSEQIETALTALKSITELPVSSPYWPHVQDNIGNALAALGRVLDAVPFYKSAIDNWQNARDKARSLSNMAAAYAALAIAGDTAEAERAEYFRLADRAFRESIRLHSADQPSLAWARVMGNFGLLLVREVLIAAVAPDNVGWQLSEAIEAFEAARVVFQDRSPVEWASLTTHLAATHANRGVRLVGIKADKLASIADIRTSIDLYTEAIPQLLSVTPDALVSNLEVSCSLLARLLPTTGTFRDIVSYKYGMLSLADRHRDGAFRRKLSEMFDRIIKELAKRLRVNPEPFIGEIEDDQIVADILSVLNPSGKAPAQWPEIWAKVQAALQARQADTPQGLNEKTATRQVHSAGPPITLHRAKGDRSLPPLPPGLAWPTETYSGSPESKRGGGGIVAYLDRVWIDLLRAGAADRRALEDLDPSAVTAIKNLSRPDPVTGERKALPDRLRFPTLKEINDRIVGNAPDAARIGASRSTKARRRA